jgi:hypothetical protein
MPFNPNTVAWAFPMSLYTFVVVATPYPFAGYPNRVRIGSYRAFIYYIGRAFAYNKFSSGTSGKHTCRCRYNDAKF